MDFSGLQRASASTNSVEHAKALHDTVIEQFSHDQSIRFIQLKKVRAQQTIMVKNYLMKYSTDGLFRALRVVLASLGIMHLYVETCVLGLIRSAQTQIYKLSAVFDTDDFHMDHMSMKHNGHCYEEYWEPASEVNTWRSVIVVEIDKIVCSVSQAIILVEQRAKLLEKQAFVAHADYVDFYEQEPPNESTKKKRIVDGKKQRTV